MKTLTNVITWYTPFWRSFRRIMIIILISTTFSVFVKTCYPLIMKQVIDSLEYDFNAHDSRLWIILLFATGLCVQLCQWWLPVIRGKTNLDIAVSVRMRLFRKILSKHPDFFSKYRNGDLVTRLTDDIDSDERMQWYGCSGIMRPIEAILVLTFSLIFMLSLNPTLTFYSVFPLPFVLGIMIGTQSIQSRLFAKRQRSVSSTVNVLESAFNGLRIVVSTVSEKAQSIIFRKQINLRNEAEMNVITTRSLLETIGALLNQCGVIIVLFVGGKMLIRDEITLGVFMAFISFFSTLTMPLWTLSWFFVSTNQVNTSIERHQSIEVFPEQELGQSQPAEQALLQVKRVQFEWSNGKTILKDIEFSLEPGQTLALVGKVGAGKSTLLNLCSGCLLPRQGQIICDGVQVHDILPHIRSQFIGYVPQECHLFSGSVLENILLGREGLSEEAIQKAMWTSCIEEEFPLNKMIYQGGVGLSGGQKARVALARALVDAPNYLILDDITAALDSKTEQTFWQRVRQSYPKAGILISTHRESTAIHADKILWIQQDHQIICEHHQTLLKKTAYTELFAKELAIANS